MSVVLDVDHYDGSVSFQVALLRSDADGTFHVNCPMLETPTGCVHVPWDDVAREQLPAYMAERLDGVVQALTSEDAQVLAELALHEDQHVRKVACANLKCPPEARAMSVLM